MESGCIVYVALNAS